MFRALTASFRGVALSSLVRGRPTTSVLVRACMSTTPDEGGEDEDTLKLGDTGAADGKPDLPDIPVLDIEDDGDAGKDGAGAGAGVGAPPTPTIVADRNMPPDVPEDLADDVVWATDEFATSDDEVEGLPAAIGGDDLSMVPAEVLEHVATPLDFSSGTDADSDVEYDPKEAFMSPAEIARNRRRLHLKRMLEDPIALPSKPLWPLYSAIVSVDQVKNKTAQGSIPSQRVLAIVGNFHGAAGFGIGKHADTATATKFALRRAQRDMISVSTHNGQLYHDLIGRKNNTTVVIRSVPPSRAGSASSLIRVVFDFMGIKHASAKIQGSKRRNPFTVVQALFDAFNHHTSPQDTAFKRGLRMQWMGSDRHTPRNYYPAYPKGPRHVPNKKEAV